MKLKLSLLAAVALAVLTFSACSNEEKHEEAVEENMSTMTDSTMHQHEHMHGDTTHSHSHEHEGDTSMHAH